MAKSRIKVLVVDDSPDVASSLAELLNLQEDMESAGILHRADGLMDHVGRSSPDVILLDLSMPGADPLDALRSLSSRQPPVHVVVCSAYDDPARIEAAMAAGARGYVSKLDDVDLILEAVRKVARGGTLPDLR